jgi:hypothetical protein
MMPQLLCHLWGDYILQSQWMAQNKTKSSIAAGVHAVCYSLLFLLLRPSIAAFAVIIVTHFFIDRFRIARYVVWAKNWIGPINWYMFRHSNWVGDFRPTIDTRIHSARAASRQSSPLAVLRTLPCGPVPGNIADIRTGHAFCTPEHWTAFFERKRSDDHSMRVWRCPLRRQPAQSARGRDPLSLAGRARNGSYGGS